MHVAENLKILAGIERGLYGPARERILPERLKLTILITTECSFSSASLLIACCPCRRAAIVRASRQGTFSPLCVHGTFPIVDCVIPSHNL